MAATPSPSCSTCSPGRRPTFTSVSLPAYAAWRLPFDLALAVSVVNVGATARVRVVPTASDTTAPTLGTPTYTASSATSGRLTWTAAKDSGQGLVGYRVMVNGAPTVFAGPAATGVDVTLPPTASSVCLNAVDAAANIASSTNQLSGSSATCPNSPSSGGSGRSGSVGAPVITGPAHGLVVRTKDAYLTWNAPSGYVTGYQVFVNDRPVGGVLRSSYRRAHVSLPHGSVTLGVAARTLTGTLGARATVTITVAASSPPGRQT